VLHAAFELYGLERHQRVRQLLFDDARFFSALVTRSEEEEQFSYFEALRQLNHRSGTAINS
jgi:hypothetical protein